MRKAFILILSTTLFLCLVQFKTDMTYAQECQPAGQNTKKDLWRLVKKDPTTGKKQKGQWSDYDTAFNLFMNELVSNTPDSNYYLEQKRSLPKKIMSKGKIKIASISNK